MTFLIFKFILPEIHSARIKDSDVKTSSSLLYCYVNLIITHQYLFTLNLFCPLIAYLLQLLHGANKIRLNYFTEN